MLLTTTVCLLRLPQPLLNWLPPHHTFLLITRCSEQGWCQRGGHTFDFNHRGPNEIWCQVSRTRALITPMNWLQGPVTLSPNHACLYL